MRTDTEPKEEELKLFNGIAWLLGLTGFVDGFETFPAFKARLLDAMAPPISGHPEERDVAAEFIFNRWIPEYGRRLVKNVIGSDHPQPREFFEDPPAGFHWETDLEFGMRHDAASRI